MNRPIFRKPAIVARHGDVILTRQQSDFGALFHIRRGEAPALFSTNRQAEALAWLDGSVMGKGLIGTGGNLAALSRYGLWPHLWRPAQLHNSKNRSIPQSALVKARYSLGIYTNCIWVDCRIYDIHKNVTV